MTEAEILRRYFSKLGRRNGSNRGKKRMSLLTARERTELARLAARARWRKYRKEHKHA